MNYVTAKEARDFFKVSGPTLMNWVNEGRLKCKKFSTRKFLYDIDSYEEQNSSETDNRKSVLYARVSAAKQSEHLNEQIESIKTYCLAKGVIIDEVYKDIASGMNEDRSGLNRLIDDVISSKIKTVYITFKDRLSRFGFKYFERLFKKFGTEIVVLDSNEESSKTFQEELTEDIIALIHHFSMKMYSNRKNKLKKIKAIIESEDDDKYNKEDM